MPTINQLVRKPRKSKVEKSKSPALNVGYNSHKKVQTNVSSPQKRGVATRVGTMTPKKPNSALRHVAKVNIYKTKRRLIGRLPGIGLLPNKYNRVLVEGGRANDLPTVRYTVIRGALDFVGLYGCKKRRSIYGARRPEGYTTHVRRRFRRLGYA